MENNFFSVELEGCHFIILGKSKEEASNQILELCIKIYDVMKDSKPFVVNVGSYDLVK